MKISVNGETMEFIEVMTVISLLDKLGIPKERVTVELNLDIVPKGRFAETGLREGDKLEIVSFVGGGQDVE